LAATSKNFLITIANGSVGLIMIFARGTLQGRVANPRLASRMRLFGRFHAAVTQLLEVPQNNMHSNKWLVKFCHCRVGV